MRHSQCRIPCKQWRQENRIECASCDQPRIIPLIIMMTNVHLDKPTENVHERGSKYPKVRTVDPIENEFHNYQQLKHIEIFSMKITILIV